MDVTTLDVYKTSGSGKKFLNLETAKEEKLLGKWYTIEEAFVDAASKFDKQGNRLDETEDKLHLRFDEIEHIFTINKTNYDTLITDFGTESDDWIGELVKLRVHTYPRGTKGIIIVSREDLADEGEPIPTKDVKNDKDIIKKAMAQNNTIRMMVDELNDMAEEVTIKNITRELKTAVNQNDITKTLYTEALEALSQ